MAGHSSISFPQLQCVDRKKKECGENECEQQASPVGTLGLTWNIVYSEECEIFPQGEMEVTQILARLNDNNGCSKGSASRLMFDFRPFVSSQLS